MREYTLARLLQPEKALSPIDVAELEIVSEMIPEQSEKADFPIVFTELGIVNDVMLEQPEKASASIDVTELPMVSVFNVFVLIP